MLIKQLEWTENRGDFEAFGCFGCFQVVEIDGRWEGTLNDVNEYESFEPHDFATADEAKAYCQSLLEKQVEGALRFVDWLGESLQKVMNVYEIIKKYLLDNNFDGLFTDDCGCLVDDLMPCDCDCSYCEPGYKASKEDLAKEGLTDDDFIVWGKKPEGKDGKD